MEFAEAVRRRRMVRRFASDRAVNRTQIAAILDLATQAPSAGFSQGWHFLVLDDVASRDAFWVATAGARPPDAWLDGMRTAPVLIIPLSDKSAYLRRYAAPDKAASTSATPAAGDDQGQWPSPYWDIDTGMASVIALLAAVDQGLAGCFFGIPAVRLPAVRTVFAIPERLTPIGIMAIGYEADYVPSKPARSRKPLDDVVTWGGFS
ncbi:MAG: Nitroreductase [Pseudonocardiales bacterium]|nr:Nitroreductase [Pseudonocardiales bacterium]